MNRETSMSPLPTPVGAASEAPADALVRLIRDKAENLYTTRQFYCTESVLVTLNLGLGGGLTEDQAIAVAAPFSIGVGESGCMCGALAGSILGAGLFVGGTAPYRHRRASRQAARHLHDRFRARFDGVCCRVLRRKRSGDAGTLFVQCARVTAEAAEMAAGYLLDRRPDLVPTADTQFLRARSSVAGGTLRRMSRLIPF
jgi:C_GCAxxG_C_C family probable redox protein